MRVPLLPEHVLPFDTAREPEPDEFEALDDLRDEPEDAE